MSRAGANSCVDIWQRKLLPYHGYALEVTDHTTSVGNRCASVLVPRGPRTRTLAPRGDRIPLAEDPAPKPTPSEQQEPEVNSTW